MGLYACVTPVKEHWEYIGAQVPQGFHPEVDGKRCYWFRLNRLGVGGVTRIIPIDKFWGGRYRMMLTTSTRPPWPLYSSCAMDCAP